MEDRPIFLKGQVFPTDDVDVSAMLDLFVARKFVIRYVDHEERKLIQINHFHRYQRPDHHERTSTLPAPANWEPARRYGSEDENAQATPRQRPGKTPPTLPLAPHCQGKAAPGLRDSGTPGQEDLSLSSLPSSLASDPDRARSNDDANDCQADQVRSVHSHYRTLHPRSAPEIFPGTPEWRKIRDRLKEGSSVAELCKAIDGYHKDPWHCGKHPENATPHLGLELIMRDQGHVTRGIEMDEKPQPSLFQKPTHAPSIGHMPATSEHPLKTGRMQMP